MPSLSPINAVDLLDSEDQVEDVLSDPGVNPLWERYIQEQCGPVKSMSDTQWAADNDVNPRTLRRWKKSPKFRELLEQHITDTHFDPSMRSAILEAMYDLAVNTGGKVPPNVQVQAQANWLRMLETVAPMAKLEPEPPKDFEEMTRAELVEEAFGGGN